ncbi:hypothetical protein D6C78_06237 [Aureobasidium pullulans]|uniref:Dienelactone hydrolase domain-containing protein n=1 Tax=Aureobasidium pullulans TaxID=5580 RepID=A0A4T0BRS0_AURPU|nr:hypothetical protein D6C78_06237 [Aureobasidium pullulans]
MASNLPDRCCIVGVRHDGSSKGEMRNIRSISTYFSYPEDRQTKNAILILTDFFGHEFINVQLIADQFAANGYFVVMPDLYEGDAVSLDRPEDFDIMAWGQKGAKVKMRSNLGVERIGSVGYCFGAKYVARFLAKGKGVDVGAMAHPSFVDADEIRAIERPLTIAAAEIDHVFSEDMRHETERILKEGKKIYQITLYSGVEHGFAVRSEMSKKEVKYAKEATFLLQVQWFREWLKEV